MAKKDWMINESELDDDQIKVLWAANDKNCIVSGCAGSGKSVLALIKAQRIQKEKGSNYQIIVFTKALSNYMNAGRETLGLTNHFTYFWDWENRMNCPSSDYVIVDEIQDFDEEEIRKFIGATKKNFFFFGDTAQSIYNGLIQNGKKKVTMPVHAINRLFSYDKEPKNFNLYRNYRLPLPIARAVQYVGVDLEVFDEGTYKSPENAKPIFLKYNSLEEQVRAISKIIGDKLTDVAILLPSNNDVIEVCRLLDSIGVNYEAKFKNSDNWRLNQDYLNFSTTNPKVMTYHSAKGLQFETVFLPNISPLQEDRKESSQKALYVAMTRTYRYLYVMYSGILPYPLNRVPSHLFQTTASNVIEDI